MSRYLGFLLVLLVMSGCARTRNEIWEDSKTASRHLGRGLNAVGGKQGESRQVYSKDEFTRCEYATADEFIPILDDEEVAFVDMQPQEVPGDPGSSVPGVEAFRDAADDPELAPIFKQVRFPYNSNLVKGRDNFMRLAHIADYMKRHPGVYIFVEGHCDERGPEAYNLALGARRSNAVRNLLISEGANPDRIFTNSYGKERPIALGHDDEAWALNRRAEFKVYDR